MLPTLAACKKMLLWRFTEKESLKWRMTGTSRNFWKISPWYCSVKDAQLDLDLDNNCQTPTDIAAMELLSLTNRATHLYNMHWRSWPSKTRPSARVLPADFGRSRSSPMCISRDVSRNFVAVEPALGMKVWLDPYKRHSPRDEFDRCRWHGKSVLHVEILQMNKWFLASRLTRPLMYLRLPVDVP